MKFQGGYHEIVNCSTKFDCAVLPIMPQGVQALHTQCAPHAQTAVGIHGIIIFAGIPTK